MTAPEFINMAKELIDKVNEINEQYVAKIREIETKMSDLQKNATNNSKQFVDTQKKKLEKELNDVKASMEAKMNKMQTTINTWRDDQIQKITGNIERSLMVKLGIDINISEIINKAKEAGKNIMNN
jgi:hypothetical protein